jgi:hypothetical protein
MMPDVPIVGEPGEIVTWWPQCLYRCKCCAPPQWQFVVLTGFANYTSCGKCGNHYAIVGIDKNGTITVDCRIVARGGGVM